MPLREALAANLSRLCEGEASIAAVCRATRINRQQFNRYLAGTALPNHRNLTKICRYFNIEDADLFRTSSAAPSVPLVKERPASLHADVQAALKRIRWQESASIPPGIYFAHFAIPDEGNAIMRSTVVIRRDRNFVTFRRLTSVAEPKGSWWSHFQGDHGGVILERLHWLYFVGLNRKTSEEPTLLVMRWIPMSTPMLGGQAVVTGLSGPSVTAVVLSRCPSGTTLRAAIKASHAYSADDPRIDSMVIDTLDQQCRALATMTRHLDLSVRALSKPQRNSVVRTPTET